MDKNLAQPGRVVESSKPPPPYHKIGRDRQCDRSSAGQSVVDAHARPPRQIILDLDATDDPLHGHQEGRFFQGYYDCYWYLPLYFCSSLLRGNQDETLSRSPTMRGGSWRHLMPLAITSS